MEKRVFEKQGIETALLGFGCMRFPTLDGEINEEMAEQMLDYAYEKGVTYFDTARPYHGGKSEPFLGKVMQKYDRSTFYLATKLPMWEVKTLDDAKRIFEEQIKNLRTDYIDFYLLHAMDRNRFQEVCKLGILDWLDEVKKEGRIRNLGFSFHDNYNAFEYIANYREWDFCQIQYNYMDTEENPGDRGYELCVKKNIPLIIMESIRGGELASLPKNLEDRMREIRPNMSTASWALRWLGSRPQIKVILSGMSAPEQVEDNLNTFENFIPLTDKEEALVADIARIIKSSKFNGCTGCDYCKDGCPQGIAISRIFNIWNKYGMYQNTERAKRSYAGFEESKRAAACIECGACEAACPQHISIRDDLKKAEAMLL